MRSAAAVFVVLLGVGGATYAQVRQPAGTEQQNDTTSSPKSSLPTTDTSPPQPSKIQPREATNNEPSIPPGKSTHIDTEGSIWSRFWPPLLTGLLALIGSGAAILYQKHALGKTLRAQEINLEKTIRTQLTVAEKSINAQLATAEKRLTSEADDKKKLEEDKRSSLVSAIATEVMFVSIRTAGYAEQLRSYGDVTHDGIERLRIIPNPVLTVDWENHYLLRTPEILMQVKTFKNLIDRANRRLDDLQRNRGDSAVLPESECKDALDDLATLYDQCTSEAGRLIDTLMKEFPEYQRAINAARKPATETSYVAFSKRRSRIVAASPIV